MHDPPCWPCPGDMWTGEGRGLSPGLVHEPREQSVLIGKTVCLESLVGWVWALCWAQPRALWWGLAGSTQVLSISHSAVLMSLLPSVPGGLPSGLLEQGGEHGDTAPGVPRRPLCARPAAVSRREAALPTWSLSSCWVRPNWPCRPCQIPRTPLSSCFFLTRFPMVISIPSQTLRLDGHRIQCALLAVAAPTVFSWSGPPAASHPSCLLSLTSAPYHQQDGPCQLGWHQGSPCNDFPSLSG